MEEVEEKGCFGCCFGETEGCGDGDGEVVVVVVDGGKNG